MTKRFEGSVTESLGKAEKIIGGLLGIVALALYLYAMHDRQTAQGVGYYAALRLGREDRRPFDLGADALRMTAFLGLLLLACAIVKRMKGMSFFRVLSLWLGLIPFANGAQLVHNLFDPAESMGMGSGLNLAGRFWQYGAQVFNVLQVWIPLLCLLLLCRQLLPADADAGAHRTGTKVLTLRFAGVAAFVCALMFLLLLTLPGFGEIWKLVFFYLMLVETFSLIEELCEKNETWNVWSFWLFVLLWIRGICKLTEILSTSRLG